MADPEQFPAEDEHRPEFSLEAAVQTVIELGREAIKAGKAAGFSVQLQSLGRQLARHDEEKHGWKTTGYNPFKESN